MPTLASTFRTTGSGPPDEYLAKEELAKEMRCAEQEMTDG